MRANLTPPEGATTRVITFAGSDDEWDRLVGELGGSFCHLAGWRHVLKEALGHETTRLAAVSASGEPTGLLPLVRVRSRLFGDYLVSMPFLSYGGPIGSAEAKRALAESALDEARRLRVDLLELRTRDPLPADLVVSERKLIVLKPLGSSAEELWEGGLRAKVRSQVRRPMKEGMTARFGLDLLTPFYDVFSCTMRDLGTPVLPRSFFRTVAERFPDEAVLGIVEHEGRAVSAGFGFVWGGELEITWAGALREHSAMAPNMLLYWSFMEEAIRREARTFNFGRCSPGSGTHRFKMQWGGEEHVLPWAQWSPRAVASTPNPDSAKFRMATAAWRRLPLSVANLLGPPISRALP